VCFEALVDDLRAVLCFAAGRTAEPTAAIIGSRTLRSTREVASAPVMIEVVPEIWTGSFNRKEVKGNPARPSSVYDCLIAVGW